MAPAVRALDGQTVGDLTFVVPRTAGDLQRWGRLLSNCLGDFGAAVACGRSTIIGIERANALAFAVEVGAGGAIRQFAGQANRAPGDAPGKPRSERSWPEASLTGSSDLSGV